jgi:secreted Zn-dependent insulinase-like peptidase
MTLCIVGKQTLDELETEIESLRFGDIEDKKQTRKVWDTHPYGVEQLGYRLEVGDIFDAFYKLIFRWYQ